MQKQAALLWHPLMCFERAHTNTRKCSHASSTALHTFTITPQATTDGNYRTSVPPFPWLMQGCSTALTNFIFHFPLFFQAAMPSPFYFFDEVDAALDTINAGRVAEYMAQGGHVALPTLSPAAVLPPLLPQQPTDGQQQQLTPKQQQPPEQQQSPPQQQQQHQDAAPGTLTPADPQSGSAQMGGKGTEGREGSLQQPGTSAISGTAACDGPSCATPANAACPSMAPGADDAGVTAGESGVHVGTTMLAAPGVCGAACTGDEGKESARQQSKGSKECAVAPAGFPAQYIVVSHRPQVFELASCLVGVYSMPGSGCSGAVVMDPHLRKGKAAVG